MSSLLAEHEQRVLSVINDAGYGVTSALELIPSAIVRPQSFTVRVSHTSHLFHTEYLLSYSTETYGRMATDGVKVEAMSEEGAEAMEMWTIAQIMRYTLTL